MKTAEPKLSNSKLRVRNHTSSKTRQQKFLFMGLALTFLPLLAPWSCDASALLPMATGAADMSLNGASIARPRNPAGALLINPAGLAAFQGTVVSSGLGVGWGSEKINTDSGYSSTNDVVAVIPDFAVSFAGPGRWRWRWGFGSYGSSGANYDFPANPAAGVPADFHAETTIIGFPLAISYQVNDQLALGAELIALFGHLRNRYAIGDQTFRYTLRGPGVQAMFGATWHPHERWSLGLGVRTPGRLWMDGSNENPNGGRQDVDVSVRMPAQIGVGVSHQLFPALEVSATVRWTDSSSFGDSIIGFNATPYANAPFIPEARDEWRWGGSLEWTVRKGVQKGVRLRAGASKSNRIVGTRGVTPLVFDNEDVRLSFGAGIDHGQWTIDTMFGYSLHEGRDVPEDQALGLPGHYDTGGGIVLFGLTRQL